MTVPAAAAVPVAVASLGDEGNRVAAEVLSAAGSTAPAAEDPGKAIEYLTQPVCPGGGRW